MILKPANGFLHIEELKDVAEDNFKWGEARKELIAAKVVSGYIYEPGDTVIVISSMIQEFEFKKNKFKLCPIQAIIAAIDEDDNEDN